MPRPPERPHTPFDQRDAACRCEWGRDGLDALAPADVVIVVDVLSFSTCVDVAASRGATILPYRWKDETAEAFARAYDAQLARRRGEGGYSLSATSFLEAPAGLRCVLPSPNGSTLVLDAASAGATIVFAGCLRNASAVASEAARQGRTVNVLPAGERWPGGRLRPSLEDWLGAGAILSRLPGTKSPEALAAIATFENLRLDLLRTISNASSGRELVERGYVADVELASQHDVSEWAPRLESAAFSGRRE
jgi:2-phosphosulfolactate phosphatase